MAVAALPLLVAAAGTVAAERGQQVQANRQRSLLNEAMARTDKTQGQTNDQVVSQASSMAPTQRMASMQQLADTTTNQEKSDLAAAGAIDHGGNAIINTSGDNGAVSGDFLKAKADRALSEGNRLSSIARQLALVRAPDQQTANEAQQRASLAEQVGSEWGDTKAGNNALQLDAQNVQLPGYAKVGKLAQMAALAYLSGGAGLGAAGTGAAGGTVWAGADSAAPKIGAYV